MNYFCFRAARVLIHMSFHCNRPDNPKTVRTLQLVMLFIMNILMNEGSPRGMRFKSQGLCAHANLNFVMIGLKHQLLL